MWWILVTVVALIAGYWLLVRPHKYWTEKGVKQGNPHFLFGEFYGAFLRKQNFLELLEMVYNKFPIDRYSGIYQFLQPILLVRDPDLIKQVTVKSFDHFTDHQNPLPENTDPLWNKNLLSLKGDKWREMRATLSPTFTSSKIKFLFSLISQNGQKFVDFFLAKKEDIITLEMKDTFTRFSSDVIANTAFGVECDSLNERDHEFYLMGAEATDVGFWKLLAYMLAPGLSKVLKISFFSQRMVNFFTTVIQNNIRSREQNGIVRPDMVHILLEARRNGFKNEESQPSQDTGFATVEESEIGKNAKNRKAEITDEDIMAQAFIFFFAGFDTVSSAMCFMSYELAINPEIQDRLILEVDETWKLCKGKLTYEGVLGMKYLDMVLSETLRKWPNPPALTRVCTKPYTIEPKLVGEKPVHLDEGTILMVPSFGLHRDPEYWPDPDRFDPERFSDENKNKIKPCTYLPFGSGPRNCIGSRFGLLEVKILFVYILAHFQIVPVEKTPIPLKITRKQFKLVPDGGFWLGFKRRAKK